MTFAVVGIKHAQAPVEIRERVAFTEAQKIEASNQLQDMGISDVVILSTCHRSEIYFDSAHVSEDIRRVKQFYQQYFHMMELEAYWFSLEADDAIHHLFEVTAGLDSKILGEDQILGQVKDAHDFSRQLGMSHKVMNRLFRTAITTAKAIKTDTHISQQPLSLSYIAIKQMKAHFDSLTGKRVMIIGAGKMGQLALQYLYDEPVETIYLTNRTYKKAQAHEREDKRVCPIAYEARYDYLAQSDVVISATSSPHFTIQAEHVDPTQSLFCLDLAVPRDIDSQLVKYPNITVYTIDDFTVAKSQNETYRTQCLDTAYTYIDQAIEAFHTWQETIIIDPIIQKLNQHIQAIESDTMTYLDHKLELSCRERKIIEKMLMSSLKRVIRTPIMQLKQCHDQAQQRDYVQVLQTLFQLNEEESLCYDDQDD